MNITVASEKTESLGRAGYYPVLDALRFLLAFWVAVGHFQMIPIFGDMNTGVGYWRLLKHGWSSLVFGTPAVIVFKLLRRDRKESFWALMVRGKAV